MLNLYGQVGAVLGPLIGAALLTVDFRVVSVCSASVFAVMALVHLRSFPREVTSPRADGAGDRPRLPRDPVFLAFAVVVGVQVVVYNQLYFLLPDAVDRAWGSQTPMGILFALAALTVVASQMPLAARVADHPPGRVLALGLGVVASGPLIAASGPMFGLRGLPALAVFTVFVFSVIVGQMIVGPAIRAVIPVFARGERLGTHYGLCASVGGVMVLPASAAIGALVDHLPGQGPAAGLPWVLLAVWAGTAALVCRRWSVLAGTRG